MATLSFSIPDDVNEAFERMFNGVDHSALIADLMRKAVAESEWRALRSSLDSGERGKPVWLDKLPEFSRLPAPHGKGAVYLAGHPSKNLLELEGEDLIDPNYDIRAVRAGMNRDFG